MYHSCKARAAPLWRVAVLVAALAALPGVAAAQMVYFSGYTNGCFNCAAPAQNAAYQSDVLGGLTYENSQFEGTTVGGQLSIGNGASAQGVQNIDNFGSFYLTADPFNYIGNTFTLLISFINPAAHTELFTAALTGQVLGNQLGGVYVNFDNTPRTWFNGVWEYSVAVNDVDLTSPAVGEPHFAAPITGRVTATAVAVPEPMSMVLLGTGLLGLGVASRRRRQLDDADLA